MNKLTDNRLDKPLIIYYPIGPTYKDRIKANLKNFSGYKFFDVIIATDDVEYFSDISYSNVDIIDLNECRKDYAESFIYEVFANEKIDQTKYKEEFFNLLANSRRFPLNIGRFTLLYEKVKNYKYIMTACCDMIPLHNEKDFEYMMDYLENVMPINSVTSNRAYYNWSEQTYLNIFEEYNNILNKEIKNTTLLEGFDDVFKVLKLEDENKLNEFFHAWNYIVIDSFQKNDTVLIGGSWCFLAEPILAMAYKLCSIKVNKDIIDYQGVGRINSFTFPEDRFWDNVMSSPEYKTANSREEYVELNHELLAKIYEPQYEIWGFKNEFFTYKN
jgi:hypothetical protein